MNRAWYGDLVVVDGDLEAVLKVNPVTGDRTSLSDVSTSREDAIG